MTDGSDNSVVPADDGLSLEMVMGALRADS